MEQEEKEVQKEEQKEREYELQEGTPTEKQWKRTQGQQSVKRAKQKRH